VIRQKVQRREPLVEELRSFGGAVRGDHQPRVCGEDGLRALMLANELVRQGSRTNEPLLTMPQLERAVGMNA
jgi:hypothetical protein